MASNYLAANHFMVEWGGIRVGFMEVHGLEKWVEVIEYKDGSSPDPGLFVKTPGLTKYGNVVMKRGMVRKDNDFADWFNTIGYGTVERRDIVISLLDSNHEPVVKWKLKNAFPVRIEYPVLNSESNEIAVETIELAHEGFTVEML